MVLYFYLLFSIFLGVCANFAFPHLSHMEVLSGTAIVFVILFAFHHMSKWIRYRKDILQTINHFQKTQENILDQLTAIREQVNNIPPFRLPSNHIMEELKILESLLNGLSCCASKANRTAPTENIPPSKDKVISPGPEIRLGKNMENSQPNTAQLSEIIRDALNGDRIDMLLQPIVSLPQRRLRSFECFSRLRDHEGGIIVPEQFLGIPGQESFIRIIDNMLLFRCVQLIRKMIKKQPDVRFFCNISLATLKDEGFLESLLEFISRNSYLSSTLVFEIKHKALDKALPEILPIIHNLASRGCVFSMDHIEYLNINFDELSEYAFRFIKIDASLLLKELEKDETGQAIHNFRKQANSHNIDVIVTHIEDEKILPDLLEFQFDFGQGYLFSPPRLSKKW